MSFNPTSTETRLHDNRGLRIRENWSEFFPWSNFRWVTSKWSKTSTGSPEEYFEINAWIKEGTNSRGDLLTIKASAHARGSPRSDSMGHLAVRLSTASLICSTCSGVRLGWSRSARSTWRIVITSLILPSTCHSHCSRIFLSDWSIWSKITVRVDSTTLIASLESERIDLQSNLFVDKNYQHILLTTKYKCVDNFSTNKRYNLEALLCRSRRDLW